MERKKLILVWFIISIVFILGLSLLFTNKNNKNALINKEIENLEIENIPRNIYNDSEYNFVVSYPSYLNQTISYEEKKGVFGNLIKSVSFSYNNLGLIGVKIYSDLNFNTIEEFLKIKNTESNTSRIETEKEFLIDEISVVVFHTVSIPPKDNSGAKVYTEEHFIYDKKAVLLKDDKLFEIWTGFGDENNHEKVWNSFKFLD